MSFRGIVAGTAASAEVGVKAVRAAPSSAAATVGAMIRRVSFLSTLHLRVGGRGEIGPYLM
ncbi:hypothetical protein M2164_000487 [Streptomyces sp. SAI-208]|nr:hypothetical protein [Streptomyces sp. SAI-208]